MARLHALVTSGLLALPFVAIAAPPIPDAAPPSAPAAPIPIERAVGIALERNLDLVARRYDVDLASAQVVTAGLRANPVLSLGADYQDLLGSHFQNDPSSGAGPPEFNVRLDYPLDVAGKRRKRVAVARADRSISELLLLNALRELAFRVRSACLDVLERASIVELDRQQLATFESVAAINEIRVRDGDLAKSELMRTRLAVRQATGAIRLSELDLARARTDLGLLLASPAGAPPVDVEGPIPSARITPALDAVRAEAASERPDLRALEQSRGRADSDVSLQRALAVTDVGLGLQYHRQTAYADGDALGFFLSGALPVFDRNQGEIQRARDARRQVDAQLVAFRAALDAEAARAVATYQAASDRLGVFERGALDEAKEVRDAAEYAYRRGDASFLELLDAQRAYNETSRGYGAALADHARARYAIDYLVGHVAGHDVDHGVGHVDGRGIGPADGTAVDGDPAWMAGGETRGSGMGGAGDVASERESE